MTPSPSDFLAAARALCKKAKPHPYWPSDVEYREALPHALSLIDSQTALLAARDAEIAGRQLLRELVDYLTTESRGVLNRMTTPYHQGVIDGMSAAKTWALARLDETDSVRSTSEELE